MKYDVASGIPTIYEMMFSRPFDFNDDEFTA